MASNYWIKLYHEILHDRKMATLSDHLYRRVIELFLLAGEEGGNGELPEPADIAWELRADEQQVVDDLQSLAKVGIVDKRESSWWVTNFAERQAPVDPEERKARFLERQRKAEYYATMKTRREQEVLMDESPEVDAGTQTERIVPLSVTKEERIVDRLDSEEIRLETEKEKDLDSHQKESAPARELPPQQSSASANLQGVAPLRVYAFKEPDVGIPKQVNQDDIIRADISAAIHYWREITGARAVHQDDIAIIGRLVRNHGIASVRETMSAEHRSITHVQAALLGTPLPQPASVPA